MVARADILAGRAVILIDIQDTIEKQLRGIRSKMRMFANSMNEIGGDLFRGGLAGTVASVFPVKEFVTFQDEMLFLQTKVQATDESIKPLEKTIRNLGMTTSFSSQEVARAATMYAQAGFSIVEIQSALQAALDLSRGSQVDLTTSTTILSNAIRTFQVDASNAALFASKFTTAARLGTLDIVDLGESLKYSAGTFANFGLELDDVLGMITTLANSGLKASLAGTSLNTAFLNLASTAPKLKQLLGVELLEADFKNPIQALRKLEEGLSKFSKIEQAGILQQLVNIRGGRAIQGLLLQGLDKLEANIQTIRRSTDEARQSAMKLDSQLGGVFRRAVSAFQELMIAIGQTSEGPLAKFGERVTKVFNDLSRLSAKNQELVQTLLLIGPASLVAGVGILTLTMILGKLAMFLTPIMMLNSVLFSMAAKLVGGNIKGISNITNEFRLLAMSLRGITGPNIPIIRMFNALYTSVSRFSRLRGARGGILGGLFPGTQTAQGAVQAAQAVASAARATAAASNGLSGPMFASSFSSAGTSISTMRMGNDLSTAFWVNFQRQSPRIAQTTGKELSNAFWVNYRQQAPRVIEGTVRASRVARLTGPATSAAARAAGSAASPARAGRLLNAARTFFIFMDRVGMRVYDTVGSAFRIIGRGLAGAARLLPSIGRGISIAFQAVFNGANFTRAVRGVQLLWRGFRGVLTILNTMRRIAFAAGPLIWLEALLLFGDRIPVIKEMMAGLGNAFSNAFGNIADIFRDIGMEIGAITKGIGKLFGGDVAGGLADIQIGFNAIVDVIRDGLLHTWQTFVKDIQPGAEFIRNMILGVIATFQALGATLGAIFGTALQGGTILIKADGSLMETLKSIFSPENMEAFFAMLVSAIGAIGNGLIEAVGFVANTLIAIRETFEALISALAEIPIFGKAAAEAKASMAANPGMTRVDVVRTQVELRRAINNILNGIQNNFTTPIAGDPTASRQDRIRAEAAAEFGAALGDGMQDFDALDSLMAPSAEGLSNVMGELTEDLEGQRQDLLNAWIKNWDVNPAVKKQAEQMKQVLGPIGKAIVGDFQSTRGNMLQMVPRMEKLQEEANEKLDDANEHLVAIVKKPPAEFAA